jgi:hypothetical protein
MFSGVVWQDSERRSIVEGSSFSHIHCRCAFEGIRTSEMGNREMWGNSALHIEILGMDNHGCLLYTAWRQGEVACISTGSRSTADYIGYGAAYRDRIALFVPRGQFRAIGCRIPFGFPRSLLPILRRLQRPCPSPERGLRPCVAAPPRQPTFRRQSNFLICRGGPRLDRVPFKFRADCERGRHIGALRLDGICFAKFTSSVITESDEERPR